MQNKPKKKQMMNNDNQQYPTTGNCSTILINPQSPWYFIDISVLINIYGKMNDRFFFLWSPFPTQPPTSHQPNFTQQFDLQTNNQPMQTTPHYRCCQWTISTMQNNLRKQPKPNNSELRKWVSQKV